MESTDFDSSNIFGQKVSFNNDLQNEETYYRESAPRDEWNNADINSKVLRNTSGVIALDPMDGSNSLWVTYPVILPIVAVFLLYIMLLALVIHKGKGSKGNVLHVVTAEAGCSPRCQYLVSFVTGSVPGSGTKAEILLQLVGSCSEVPFVNITKVANSVGQPNPGRRAAKTRVALWTQESIGEPRMLQLKLRKCDYKDSWLLKHCTITDPVARIQHVAVVDSQLREGSYLFPTQPSTKVSPWRLVWACLPRAFCHYYLWDVWSTSSTSSLSSPVSLSLCFLLVLAIMGVSAALVMPDLQKSWLEMHQETDDFTFMFLLDYRRCLTLFALIVTLAAVMWLLETCIRSVKKEPKTNIYRSYDNEIMEMTDMLHNKDSSKALYKRESVSRRTSNIGYDYSRLQYRKPADTEGAIRHSVYEGSRVESYWMQETPETKRQYHSPILEPVEYLDFDLPTYVETPHKSLLSEVPITEHSLPVAAEVQPSKYSGNLRSLVQSRVQDLLHDTGVYLDYSTSSCSVSTNLGVSGKETRSSDSVIDHNYIGETTSAHREIKQCKISCALCKRRQHITERKRHGSQSKDINVETQIQHIAEDVVKIVKEHVADMHSQSSLETDYMVKKKISAKLQELYSDKENVKQLNLEETHLPKSSQKCVIRETMSDTSLAPNIEPKLVSERTASITDAAEDTRQSSETSLSKFIKLFVKKSVTDNVHKVMETLQQEKITEDASNNEITRSTYRQSDVCSDSEATLVDSEDLDFKDVNTPELTIEDLRQVLQDSMKAVEEGTSTRIAREAVQSAMRNATASATEEILQVLLDTLFTSPHKDSSTSHVSLVVNVRELIERHHDLVSSVKNELLAYAYSKQYAEILITNAIIRTKYYLSQGADIYKNSVTQTVFDNCTWDSMDQEKWNMTMHAFSYIAFKERLIKAVLEKAVADLKEQMMSPQADSAKCCCEIVNQIYPLVSSDDLHLTNFDALVDNITDEMVRILLHDAARFIGENILDMVKETEGTEALVAMSAGQQVGSTLLSLPRAASPTTRTAHTICAQAVAGALLQLQQDFQDPPTQCVQGRYGLANNMDRTEPTADDMNRNENAAPSNSWPCSRKSSSCTVDVEGHGSCNWVVKNGCQPPQPQQDEALLELEERLSGDSPGCLPTYCLYLLYPLLAALALAATAAAGVARQGLAGPAVWAWLLYVAAGLAVHALLLEPAKALVVGACNILGSHRVY